MTWRAFAIEPIIENIVAEWQVKLGSRFAFQRRCRELNSALVRVGWMGIRGSETWSFTLQT